MSLRRAAAQGQAIIQALLRRDINDSVPKRTVSGARPRRSQRLLAAPDEYHGSADRHPRAWMVLGVHGKDPHPADEQVVDVTAAP